MKWLILNANTEINETNEMTGIDGVDNIDEIDDISDICQDWLNQNKCQCRYCDTLCSKYSMSLSTGKNHQINYTEGLHELHGQSLQAISPTQASANCL